MKTPILLIALLAITSTILAEDFIEVTVTEMRQASADSAKVSFHITVNAPSINEARKATGEIQKAMQERAVGANLPSEALQLSGEYQGLSSHWERERYVSDGYYSRLEFVLVLKDAKQYQSAANALFCDSAIRVSCVRTCRACCGRG